MRLVVMLVDDMAICWLEISKAEKYWVSRDILASYVKLVCAWNDIKLEL